ncbi:MAG: dockerin type I domain-containing protein, partial [Saprospiraceae bacterium]
TLDLVLTQRHILGLEPFSNPLQYLAADVNNDRKITASDLVQMRKILLGIDTHFKNNTSWIFLDETSVANETNPWLMKRYIHIPNGTNNVDGLRFIPVKVGDVDGASHAKINVQK